MAHKRISRGRPPHQTPAARARRAHVDPVIRALLAWRRQYCLSQVAAAEFARVHGFPKPYKKAVFLPFTPFEKDTLDKSRMIPWILDDYMKKRDANAFNHDINDPAFREVPAYQVID